MLRLCSNLTRRAPWVALVLVAGLVSFAPQAAWADDAAAAPAASQETSADQATAVADQGPVAGADEAAGDEAAMESDASTDAALRALLPRDLSPWGMFMGADIVVKLVLIGLAFASVLTWTIWLAKSLELTASRRRVISAFSALSSAKSLEAALASAGKGTGAVQALVKAADFEMRLSLETAASDKDGIKERVGSRLERIEAAVGRRMGLGTGPLATIGATAPFVGLFGTVWGIMNSFIGISQSQTTNLAVVAPGIAEALLATAFGLVAAIPAVVIYNMFARIIAQQRAMVADAAAEVLRLVSRDLDRQGVSAGRTQAAE